MVLRQKVTRLESSLGETTKEKSMYELQVQEINNTSLRSTEEVGVNNHLKGSLIMSGLN